MCRKHDHHVDEVRYSGGMVDALAIFAGGVCPEVAIKEKCCNCFKFLQLLYKHKYNFTFIKKCHIIVIKGGMENE